MQKTAFKNTVLRLYLAFFWMMNSKGRITVHESSSFDFDVENEKKKSQAQTRGLHCKWM